MGPQYPKELALHLQGHLKGFAAVCHESLADNPDGVWVGYADGHIELVRDGNALKSALSQFDIVCPLTEKMWEQLVVAQEKAPKEGGTGVLNAARNLIESLLPQKLVLKLIDESGQPVAGAGRLLLSEHRL